MARHTKVVGVSLPPETLDRISEAAEAERRSRSTWIALACEEKLARAKAAASPKNVTTNQTPAAEG